VLLGNGNGTFNTATKLPGVGSSSFVATGDFNGDGFPDIALTAGNTISVLSNKQDGTFGALANFVVGGVVGTVAVGDLNGDGKLDLATVSGNISVLLNNGDGSFGSPANFSVGGDPFSVAIGDFNGDGKADLATLQRSNFLPGDFVSVLLGTGGGSFGSPTSFPVGILARSIAVEDFDRDGVLDLVVLNLFPGNVSVLLGTGTGSFGFATQFSVGNPAFFVASFDVNNDGKPDIATANLTGNVSVLLNTTPSNYTVTIARGANASELNSSDGTFLITLDNPVVKV
jgi:hypothetical protein